MTQQLLITSFGGSWGRSRCNLSKNWGLLIICFSRSHLSTGADHLQRHQGLGNQKKDGKGKMHHSLERPPKNSRARADGATCQNFAHQTSDRSQGLFDTHTRPYPLHLVSGWARRIDTALQTRWVLHSDPSCSIINPEPIGQSSSANFEHQTIRFSGGDSWMTRPKWSQWSQWSQWSKKMVTTPLRHPSPPVQAGSCSSRPGNHRVTMG